MQRNAALDLVVFDLGGVLIDIARTWDEAAERAGLAGRPIADLARFEAEGGRLTAQFQVGAIEAAAWFPRHGSGLRQRVHP